MKVRELIAKLSEHDQDAPVLVRVEPDGSGETVTDRAGRVRSTDRGAVVIDPGESELPFGKRYDREVKDGPSL